MERSDGFSMILSYLRDLKDMIHVLRDLLIWRPGDLLLLLKKFFNSILYEDPLHVEYHNRSRWVWKMGLPLKTISICAVFSLQQFARKYKFRKQNNTWSAELTDFSKFLESFTSWNWCRYIDCVTDT